MSFAHLLLYFDIGGDLIRFCDLALASMSLEVFKG